MPIYYVERNCGPDEEIVMDEIAIEADDCEVDGFGRLTFWKHLPGCPLDGGQHIRTFERGEWISVDPLASNMA